MHFFSTSVVITVITCVIFTPIRQTIARIGRRAALYISNVYTRWIDKVWVVSSSMRN